MARRATVRIKFQDIDTKSQTSLLEYIKREAIDIDINTVEIIGYKPINRRIKKINDALYRVKEYESYRFLIGHKSWLYNKLKIDKKTFKRWCEFGVFGTDLIEYNNRGNISITDVCWCDVVKRIEKYLIDHPQE